MTSSAVSKVVNRSPQERHSRRRRIWCPSTARRESVTLVSSWLQNGQCTAPCPRRASGGRRTLGGRVPSLAPELDALARGPARRESAPVAARRERRWHAPGAGRAGE